MQTKTHQCAYCGFKAEAIEGPVVPVDPRNPPTSKPPGSGFYECRGPSNGSGWDQPGRMYCSANHMARVEERGETPLAISEPVAINGWQPVGRSQQVTPRRAPISDEQLQAMERATEILARLEAIEEGNNES